MKRLTILLVIIISSLGYSQKRSGFGLHAGSNSTGVYDVTSGYYDESQSSWVYQDQKLNSSLESSKYEILNIVKEFLKK